MSSKTSEVKYVQDIFALAAGGSTEVAYKLGLHTRTVDHWPKRGIPDKYWDKLHKEFGITPIECFRLNAKIKGYRA